MCTGYLLAIPLIASIYYVFHYRSRFLAVRIDDVILNELLKNSEQELLEVKSKCRELERENKELERLNQVHELKAQVRQADLKRTL